MLSVAETVGVEFGKSKGLVNYELEKSEVVDFEHATLAECQYAIVTTKIVSE